MRLADGTVSMRSPGWWRWPLVGFSVAVVLVLAATGPGLFARLAEFRPSDLHSPNWALIAEDTRAVRIHLTAAVGALLVGTALMSGVKGSVWHKRLGWTYVVLIMAAAVSSLLIRRQNDGDFSFIHALSGWTILTLPLAVMWARRGNIARHRRSMMSLFFGGLVFAGVLAFLPGRLLWRVFLG